MLGSGMLSTLVVLLMISVIARESSLFLLALALLVAAGLSRLWECHCLTGVEYRRSFSQHQVPYGEVVQLEIEDEIPQELRPDRGRVYSSHKPGRALLANLLAPRPYEWVKRRYTIPCLNRGEHIFGAVWLRSGDLFGFVSAERTLELADTVVVFPRVVPLTELGITTAASIANSGLEGGYQVGLFTNGLHRGRGGDVVWDNDEVEEVCGFLSSQPGLRDLLQWLLRRLRSMQTRAPGGREALGAAVGAEERVRGLYREFLSLGLPKSI